MREKIKNLPIWAKLFGFIIAIALYKITFIVGFGWVTYLAIKKTLLLIKDKKVIKCIPFAFLSIMLATLTINISSLIIDSSSTKTSSNTSSSKNAEVKKEEVFPAYNVNSIDDTNIANAIRINLNIVVTGDYTLDDLYKIAVKEIESYTSKNKVNACVAGFYNSTDHIGKGYDMGRVEYVPNGNFADAVKVTTGDYSTFKYVNYLEEAIVLPQGESLKEGGSDIELIKNDFASTYEGCIVTAELKNSTLYITCTEKEDHPFVAAEENAIASYTDFSLDNIKSDINSIDITVIRPSSSVHAVLDMSKMSTDNGRYFDTNYIRSKIS